MTKILLFGAGGVGGIYTYILDKGGADVTAVCRSNYTEVKQNGFEISSEIFGEVTVRPKVVRTPNEAEGPFDYIVVCSKVTVGISPSTSELISACVTPDTSIVLAQNGIGIEDEYAVKFPHNTIISGSVYLPTTQGSPGKISMGNQESLNIGTFPADASRESKTSVEKFASLFHKAGATCTVYEDVQVERWNKLMLNVALNPVCALTLLSDADFLRSSDVAETFLHEVMHEVLSVAHKLGHTQLSSSDVERQLDRSKQRVSKGEGVEPSMLADVRNGRTMEIEAILGNLIRIADKHNVKVVRCATMYALAKGLNFSIEKTRRTES